MIGRVTFTAVLAASLCACAGAARPAASPELAASPEIAGSYEFSGFVAGVGPISGRMDVGAAVNVAPTVTSQECPGLPVVAGASVGCTVRRVRVVPHEGGAARLAVVLIAVTNHLTEAPICSAAQNTRCPSTGRIELRQTFHRGVVELSRSE